jgi:multimeric flavodoxin WrbA
VKVLGIAGSPRRGGNTDMLLAEVLRGASSKGAEVKTIVICDLDIAPCQHCDFCLKTGSCQFGDDMQRVYQELAASDRIVLASPLFFMGVTAQMKAMIDRCQAFWVRKHKFNMPPLGDRRDRKGLFVSVGGRQRADLFQPAIATVKALFSSLDVRYLGELVFSGVDDRGAITGHPDALKQAYLAGQKLVTD